MGERVCNAEVVEPEGRIALEGEDLKELKSLYSRRTSVSGW